MSGSDRRLWWLAGGVLLLIVLARSYTTAIVRQYSPSARAASLIDLNSAGEVDLEEIPGVGAALASRIVRARERGGPFSSAEELSRRVEGLGPERVQLLMEFVRLVPASTETAMEAPTEAPTEASSETPTP